MADKETEGKIQEGTFEWKIKEYLKTTECDKKSPLFKVGRCNSFLHFPEINKLHSCSPVYLETEGHNTFSYKTSYKLSLVDRNGKEFLLVKRIPLGKDSPKLFLTSMGHFNLSPALTDLLPEGTLTLRLSWSEVDSAICNRDAKTISDLTTVKESVALESLSKDFCCFYKSKTNTDCVIKVGKAQFPVHSQILSARSTVFAAMFHHDSLEKRSGVVDIPDVDATVLEEVLHYIYSGKVSGVTASMAVGMYVTADKYALFELRDICLDVLKQSLTVENICDVALLAHTHGELDLGEKVVVFLKDNLEEIEESLEWKELTETKPSLTIKLLRSALMVYKNSDKKSSSK